MVEMLVGKEIILALWKCLFEEKEKCFGSMQTKKEIVFDCKINCTI